MTRAWTRSSRCRRFNRVAPVGALLVKKCEGPSSITAHVPALLLLSPRISQLLPCTIMSMEYPCRAPRVEHRGLQYFVQHSTAVFIQHSSAHDPPGTPSHWLCRSFRKAVNLVIEVGCMLLDQGTCVYGEDSIICS